MIHSFPLSPFRKRRVLRRIVCFCRFQVEIHPAIQAWGLSSIRRGLLCLSDFFELIPSTEGTRRRAGYSQSLVSCHARAREGADRDCFEVVGIELSRSEAQWNVEECKQAEAFVTSRMVGPTKSQNLWFTIDLPQKMEHPTWVALKPNHHNMVVGVDPTHIKTLDHVFRSL